MSCQTLAWWSVKGEFSADRRNEVNPSRESVGPDGSEGSEFWVLRGDGAGEGVGGTKGASLDEACDAVSSVLSSGSDVEKLAGDADTASGRPLFAGSAGD